MYAAATRHGPGDGPGNREAAAEGLRNEGARDDPQEAADDLRPNERAALPPDDDALATGDTTVWGVLAVVRPEAGVVEQSADGRDAGADGAATATGGTGLSGLD